MWFKFLRKCIEACFQFGTNCLIYMNQYSPWHLTHQCDCLSSLQSEPINNYCSETASTMKTNVPCSVWAFRTTQGWMTWKSRWEIVLVTKGLGFQYITVMFYLFSYTVNTLKIKPNKVRADSSSSRSVRWQSHMSWSRRASSTLWSTSLIERNHSCSPPWSFSFWCGLWPHLIMSRLFSYSGVEWSHVSVASW